MFIKYHDHKKTFSNLEQKLNLRHSDYSNVGEWVFLNMKVRDKLLVLNIQKGFLTM